MNIIPEDKLLKTRLVKGKLEQANLILKIRNLNQYFDPYEDM